MILVSKERWDHLQALKPPMEKEEGKMQDPEKQIQKPKSESIRTDGKADATGYKTLLNRLALDLKKRVPSRTKGGGGGGGGGGVVERVGKKSVRKRSNHPRPPPPGIPDRWTPPAKETEFRDLSKKPPRIKDWEDY